MSVPLKWWTTTCGTRLVVLRRLAPAEVDAKTMAGVEDTPGPADWTECSKAYGTTALQLAKPRPAAGPTNSQGAGAAEEAEGHGESGRRMETRAGCL